MTASCAIRRGIPGIITALVASCAPPDAKPVADTPRASPQAAPLAANVGSAWSDELGGALFVPADSESIAVVLAPRLDGAIEVGRTPVVLLNAAGDSSVVRVSQEPVDSLRCGDAPVVRLAGGVLTGWSVGLQGRTARIIPMDSAETLPASDSSRITTALARLASTLTAREESRFNGLPFAVARARRLRVDDRVVVVAHLVRRVPQESAPLEEHTLLIAERAAAVDSPFTIEYSQQSSGSEENAEHFEALAAVRTRDGVIVLLARDRMSQTTYVLLERSPAGAWRVRWERVLAC